MLIYEEHPIRTTKPFRVEDYDATAQYVTHFSNSLLLKFFHTKGTREEKQQAARELTICERKMKFWQRAPNYSQQAALTAIDKLNKTWQKAA